MTSQTMNQIGQSGSSSQGESLDSSSIKSIQLADGWHNVSNCEIVPFAISNSPVYQYFPTLKYNNENNQEVYTPLKQVLGFSQEVSKSSR